MATPTLPLPLSIIWRAGSSPKAPSGVNSQLGLCAVEKNQVEIKINWHGKRESHTSSGFMSISCGTFLVSFAFPLPACEDYETLEHPLTTQRERRTKSCGRNPTNFNTPENKPEVDGA